MINFFRKIRYDLMEKNKTGKYLKYAIGEIVLVMIGILLALQVNNWNETRKNRNFELKILSEIRDGLEGDLDFLENNTIYRTKLLDSTLNVAIEFIKNKETFSDSLYFNGFAGYLEIGYAINFNNGPYEALKSAGIDKITNDSLRNSLINYYDFELPFRIVLLEEYEQQYYDHIAILESLRLEGEVLEGTEGDYLARVYPKDLFKQAEFKRFVWLSKRRADRTLRRVDRFIPIIKEVLENVKKELETTA